MFCGHTAAFYQLLVKAPTNILLNLNIIAIVSFVLHLYPCRIKENTLKVSRKLRIFIQLPSTSKSCYSP